MALTNPSKVEASKFKNMSLPASTSTLASVESLSIPLVQEVVISADIRCQECQKRVADVISRMNDTESLSINVLEKKVTLTCRYSSNYKLPTRRLATVLYRNPLGKFAVMKHIFRSPRK